MFLLRRWLRSLNRKRSQQVLARSISAPARNVYEDLSLLLPCAQGILVVENVGFGCRMGRVKLYSSEVPANRRSLCSSSMRLCHADSAVECSESFYASKTLDLQENKGIANIEFDRISLLSTDIVSIDGNNTTERQSTALAAPDLFVADGVGGAWSLQENANVERETMVSHASAAMKDMDSLDTTQLISKALHEQHRVTLPKTTWDSKEGPLHDQHSVTLVSTTCDSKEDPLLYEEHRVVQRIEETPDFESSITGNGGDENAELMLNVDDLSGFSKCVVAPDDVKMVQDICNLLESKGWDTSTEAFLNTHYASQLPHLLVAKIINRQKSLALAKPFFEWACKQLGHDLYSCHAFLLKLGENKHFDEMWELLNKVRNSACQVNETTFCIMIKAYGCARMPDMAMEVFTKLNDYGVVADTHVFTTLISVFFKLRLLDEARLCYRKMLVDGVKLDAHAFSTLIRGFGMTGSIRDAQVCFDMILADGFEADISTFNSLIEGFCCNNAMKSAMSAFSAMQKRGLKPNSSTFNMLIKAFCKDGKLQDAINVLASMKEVCVPNQATFNILLQGLLANEEISKAIEFFKLMRKEGWVDARSYIFLSNGLRQVKQTDEILDLLRSLLDADGFANTEVCNTLIYNLSHLGELDEAERIFRGMVAASTSPNVPSYAIMISSYCRAGKLQEAMGLLAELKGQGCKPSSFCYIPIVSRMLKMDRVADALKYVEEMLDLGLEVNSVTCDFLLKVLCRQGMVDDAIKVCDIIVDKRLPLCVDTFFEFMKCLCTCHSIEVANAHFRIMHKQHVLPKCKAVSQALAVMDKMGSFYNEE
eukprot:c21873_g1_i1 orf=179-2641(+)